MIQLATLILLNSAKVFWKLTGLGYIERDQQARKRTVIITIGHPP
jgi:hypothetical protein